MVRLTIGQMAKLNNITEQALRYYDKIKLFEPEIINNENGYRYYSIEQSAYLDMIQYMKSLGLELKEIKKYLEANNPLLIKNILEQKNTQLSDKIKELQYQKRAIERTIERLQRYKASPPDGTIILEYIEERQIYCIDCGVNIYDYGIDVYEEQLRKLKNDIISNKLPQIYFCNVGTILRKNNLKNHNFYSSDIFIFIDREFVSDEFITIIPANNYLCIYCDKFENERKYIERLLISIEQNGYIINGDYICEVLAEFPYLEKNSRGMYLRLQIPIKFK